MNIKNKIKNIWKNGFFQIIGTTTLSKLVSFTSAMFLPRFLSVSDYGILTYIETILSYILMMNGLGMANSTLKYCVSKDKLDKKEDYFIITTNIGLIFDFVIFIIWEVGVKYIPLQYEEARKWLALMGLIPLFTFIFENIQSYLRAKFENTKYMLITCCYSISFIILQIIMTIKFGIVGDIIAKYIVLILSIIIGIVLLKNSKIVGKFKVTMIKIFELIKFGLNIMVGNVASLAITLNEVFIINKVFENVNILAQYKVGSYTLPIALFLTNAIVMYLIPYFTQNSEKYNWIWEKFRKIFKINAICMLLIHILLFVFAEKFIYVFFGEQYKNAVPIMRTLIIASFIQAVFKAIPGNILAFIGKEKFNLIVNIVSLIIHFISEYILLNILGTQAIGIGLIIAYAISGISMYIYLYIICRKGEKNELDKKNKIYES